MNPSSKMLIVHLKNNSSLIYDEKLSLKALINTRDKNAGTYAVRFPFACEIEKVVCGNLVLTQEFIAKVLDQENGLKSD